MILGGCGASLEELTGLYSSFANEGIYSKPFLTESNVQPGKKEILSPLPVL